MTRPTLPTLTRPQRDELVQDAFIVLGLALVGVGLGLVSLSLALVVVGAVMLGLGCLPALFAFKKGA